MKKTKKLMAFLSSVLIVSAMSSGVAYAEDSRTTDAFIPEGMEVADSTVPDEDVAPTDNINNNLAEICDTLRKNVLDSDTVYVASREGLVIFGSEKQQDIDTAKAYCLDNSINLDQVFFILIKEEATNLITDHETIITMLNDFVKEKQLSDVRIGDDEASGKIILSYYYVYPEQKEMFENFFSEKNIDSNEITMLVMESTGDTPDNNDDSVLPQTGYSKIHKAIAGLATLMTAAGAALAVKGKKKDE